MDLQWDLQRNRDRGQFIVEENVWHPSPCPFRTDAAFLCAPHPQLLWQQKTLPKSHAQAVQPYLEPLSAGETWLNKKAFESRLGSPRGSLGTRSKPQKLQGTFLWWKKTFRSESRTACKRDLWVFAQVYGSGALQVLGQRTVKWVSWKLDKQDKLDKRTAMWAQAGAKDPLRECTAVVVEETADDGREDASQLE